MSDTPATTEQIIPLEPVARKFAERYSLLTHLAVALSLMQEAIPAVRANPGGEWFGWVELAAASALIAAAVRELKAKPGESHSGVAWTEIAAGLVLLVEAALKWREGPRHYPLAMARALAASLVIGIGVGHARLRRATSLRIDDAGVRWRRKLFLASRIDWEDVKGITLDDRALSFLARDGDGPVLRLKQLKNREAIGSAIASAAALRGIAVTDLRTAK